VSGLQQRDRDLGSSHAPPSRGIVQNWIRVDRTAKCRQAIAHLVNAPTAIGALAIQERLQRGGCRVQEVAEHVHVAPLLDGRHLDAGDELDAGVTRHGSCGVDTCGGVVIGDADDGKARSAGLFHELWRRERAVRRRRMQVQVDQKQARR